MLGQSLILTLKQNGFKEIYMISKTKNIMLDDVNLIQLNDLESRSLNFYCFFHCAAEVNVNLCEKDFKHAIHSNVDYTRLLFSKIKSEKLFYISTDAVYDGFIGDYKEVDNTSPINNYAKSKLLGEKVVDELAEKYYIIRTNIFGRNSKNKNSLFEWGENEIKQGKNIPGYTNMFFNPLYVGHLAQVLFELMGSNLNFGIYNVGSSDYISKYDFLQQEAEFLDCNQELIQPIEYVPQNDNVVRPLNTTLNCNKLLKEMPNLDLSIKKSFSMLKKDY